MSTIILWPQTAHNANGRLPDSRLSYPDGNPLGLNANDYVKVENFQGGYSRDLLPLLNGSKGGDVVTAEMLARTKIIAFELNGDGAANGLGWESSHWSFSDGVNPPFTIDWDERTTPAAYQVEVVANGSTDRNNYASFFDFTWPPGIDIAVVSYILFDLPTAIDITSPNFTITVSAWGDGEHGEGTPDPDAIGIFACTARDHHNEGSSHMTGFYHAGIGGGVRQWRQEFAHLDLPPGKYLLFGKVQIAIGSAAVDPLGTAYQVILEVGGVQDEAIGALRYDTADPGSRFEAIALNVAVETDSPVRASLLISATDADRLYVWEPRLSAIQVEELHLSTEHNERGAIGQQSIDLDRLATLATAGERRVTT